MDLKPWPVVVDIFNYENNENITEENARGICARALNKLLRGMVRDPEARAALETHLRPSEYKRVVKPILDEDYTPDLDDEDYTPLDEVKEQ